MRRKPSETKAWVRTVYLFADSTPPTFVEGPRYLVQQFSRFKARFINPLHFFVSKWQKWKCLESPIQA